MSFGWHGLKADGREPDTPQKRCFYYREAYRPKAPKHDATIKKLLSAAKKDAKSRGLTLEEYFKLPREERNF